MDIGEGNWFMVGCCTSCQDLPYSSRMADGAVVESPSIGSFNTFQVRSQASASVRISDRCTLSAGTTLDGPEMEILSPYTVIYGSRSERIIGAKGNGEGEENMRVKHLEYLREIIPK